MLVSSSVYSSVIDNIRQELTKNWVNQLEFCSLCTGREEHWHWQCQTVRECHEKKGCHVDSEWVTEQDGLVETCCKLSVNRTFDRLFQFSFTSFPAESVLLGGIPSASIVYPSSVWTINLRKGFVGCIKNVRFNGLSAKIANVLENSNTTGMFDRLS